MFEGFWDFSIQSQGLLQMLISVISVILDAEVSKLKRLCIESKLFEMVNNELKSHESCSNHAG